MERIEFNKIYFGTDSNGCVHLLFTNAKNVRRLYFGGIHFYRGKEIVFLQNLILFSYNSNEVDLRIEKISQDLDMSFLQISNGDIFQIYSMFDDEKAGQKLAIFDEATKKYLTPLGISVYEAAVKRANEAEVVIV